MNVPRKNTKTAIKAGYDDPPFWNTFPGIDRMINGVAGKFSYIDLESVLDVGTLSEYEQKQFCKYLFRAKRSTILNVDWTWFQLLKMKEKTCHMSVIQFNTFLKTLEQRLFKFLQLIGLWHDPIELVLIICKFWIHKSGNKNNVYKYHTSLLFWASLSWNVLKELITQYAESSILSEYNGFNFLKDTRFDDITNMMHTLYLVINTYLECCGLRVDYAPELDHYFFINLCMRCDGINTYALYYYVKYGPIKYQQEPYKSQIIQMISNDYNIRRLWINFFKNIQEFEAQISKGSLVLSDCCDDLILIDSNFRNNFFEGINPLVHCKDELMLKTQNDSRKIGDKQSWANKWFDQCIENYHFSRKFSSKMNGVFGKKVKNRSVVTNVHFTPFKWFKEIQHLEFIVTTKMNVILWQLLPLPMKQLYQLLLNVKGYIFKLDRNCGTVTLAACVDNIHFFKIILWLNNQDVSGFEADNLLAIHIILHYLCQLLFKRAKHRRDPAVKPVSQYPFDWHCVLFAVFRNWQYYVDDAGDYSFPFGLYRLVEMLYDSGGPYEHLNAQLYNYNTFKLQFESIFMHRANLKKFYAKYKKWLKNNGVPALSLSFNSNNLDTYLKLFSHKNDDNEPSADETKETTVINENTSESDVNSSVQGSIAASGSNNSDNGKNTDNEIKQQEFSVNVANSITPPMPSPITPPMPLTPPLSRTPPAFPTLGSTIKSNTSTMSPPNTPPMPLTPPLSRTPPPFPVDTNLTSAKLAAHNNLTAVMPNVSHDAISGYSDTSESDFTYVPIDNDLSSSLPHSKSKPNNCQSKPGIYVRSKMNSTPMQNFMSDLGIQDSKTDKLLKVQQDIANDELSSNWNGSNSSFNTQWHLESKQQSQPNQSTNIQNATNVSMSDIRLQFQYLMQNSFNVTQYRRVSIENGLSDWQGIHSRQQDLITVDTDIANQDWIKKPDYDVNYCHSMCNNKLFLFEEPTWQPEGIATGNRSINKIQQWVTALDDNYHHISEVGQRVSTKEYLS